MDICHESINPDHSSGPIHRFEAKPEGKSLFWKVYLVPTKLRPAVADRVVN